jgi:thioredoxin-related protein
MNLLPKRHMRKSFSQFMLIGIIVLAAAAARAQAAELVMVERDGCPWCAAFDREIAPAYGKTDEGRRAPLRRIRFDQAPADLAFLQIDRFTPVFILVDGGREIGRIRGYPGPDGFWMQLAVLMRDLDAAGAGAPAAKPVPLTN